MAESLKDFKGLEAKSLDAFRLEASNMLHGESH